MPRDPLPPNPGTSPRATGHSSGDRNTKRAHPGRAANTRPGDEADWPVFHDGEQRNATPAVAPDAQDACVDRPSRGD